MAFEEVICPACKGIVPLQRALVRDHRRHDLVIRAIPLYASTSDRHEVVNEYDLGQLEPEVIVIRCSNLTI